MATLRRLFASQLHGMRDRIRADAKVILRSRLQMRTLEEFIYGINIHMFVFRNESLFKTALLAKPGQRFVWRCTPPFYSLGSNEVVPPEGRAVSSCPAADCSTKVRCNARALMRQSTDNQRRTYRHVLRPWSDILVITTRACHSCQSGMCHSDTRSGNMRERERLPTSSPH